MRRSESFLTAILFIKELIFRRLAFSLAGTTILSVLHQNSLSLCSFFERTCLAARHIDLVVVTVP